MWNTRFGMMGVGGASITPALSATQATKIATEWLADRDGGLTADTAEALPGYYTLHTLHEGEVEGMLSVNSITGDVWSLMARRLSGDVGGLVTSTRAVRRPSRG